MSHSTETQGSKSSADRCLIYDQDCRLCVSIKNRLSNTVPEDRVQFVPYASKEAESLLGGQYHPGRPSMAYLIDEAGGIRQGLDAFIPLLSGLWWGKWVLPLWRFAVVRSCGYALYRLIARYRYRWFGPSS